SSDGNDEPFLGWSEQQSLDVCIATGNEFSRQGDGPARFAGGGSIAARTVLRNLRSRRPDVRQNDVGGFLGNPRGFHVDGLRIGGDSASRSASPRWT
ncbi:hypothetical protein AB4144_34280, partial [Rhizobiaceae sp. 2RAB30]